jgi:allantoinase
MSTTVVRSERVVLPHGIRPATIHIDAGRIVHVGTYDEQVAAVRELNVGPLVVLPGLVETHVHINEPGRADWEGFAHATRAAAAGGVTTLIDMPLNSIPATTTVAALDAKRAAADGQCHVDVGFWGGVVPGNTSQLAALARAGIHGFKCFLCPSGVDEFPSIGERELREALPILATLGLPLLAHAELPALLHDPLAPGIELAGDPRRYTTWLHSRPPVSEQAAIDLLIRLARAFQVHVHIVHLASGDALSSISMAKREGLSLTVETCPHYLTFAAEDIRDGHTAFKCAPPIREHSHRDRLWQGLASGDIDFVATDHSPSPPALKRLDEGDFLRAWGGIASLQVGLAAVWTGLSRRSLPMEWLARWLAQGPAHLAGLDRTKGAIAPGCDADLVIWDPDTVSTVDGAALFHRHPVTPYDGERLQGQVKTTLLRGDVVFDEGECRGKPAGRLMRRN